MEFFLVSELDVVVSAKHIKERHIHPSTLNYRRVRKFYSLKHILISLTESIESWR